MTLIFTLRQGLRDLHGLNQAAKTDLTKGPLAANGRDAFQPYSCKQGAIMTPFLYEQKRTGLGGIKVYADISGREKEPDLGLFTLRDKSLIFRVFSRAGKRGEGLHRISIPVIFTPAGRLVT